MIQSSSAKLAQLSSFVTLITLSGYAASADDESAIIAALNQWNTSPIIHTEQLRNDAEMRPMMRGGGGALRKSRDEDYQLRKVTIKMSNPEIKVVGSKANVTFARILQIDTGQTINTHPSNQRFSVALEKKDGIWQVDEDSLASQASITRD